ncbi:ATP-binding protein [Algoriphagus sp. CAU 1675]|uniref:ATP-binding protein n=1 Tax=Algoriphagus sp. CAU 1675 TaxID=3032597 RepID=UPI0023DC98D8|nr:ATP-binding protein [Algoriphagus sp. CAU 1675]MDF2156745.1 ATP-binding protein [Algoriphagus sp. CAU 1675]
MVAIQKKEAEALETYHIYWKSYFSGDYKTIASILDDHFEFIGISETGLSHGREDGPLAFQAGLRKGNHETRLESRKIISVPVGDLVLVKEEADLHFLKDGIWTFYSPIRISSILSETPFGWKIVQQHQSIPEGEFPSNKRLAEENLQLRKELRKSEENLQTIEREFEIEAALERVRSRSMAMHKSEELQEVVNAVFDNLMQLEVATDTVTILIPKADSKDIEVWIQNKDRNYSSRLLMPYYESSQIGRDLVKAREEKIELFTHHYSKEEKDKWFLHLFNHPESLISIPKERKEFVLGGPSYCISSAFNTHTGMYMGRYYGQPFSISENNILIRFARVFEQTYTRFLDLQKAENQTKEAIKQASLDRLRADIASMRTADDLNRITPLIWKELTSMGISFIRCGVFIMDDQKNKFHTYLSTPDGQAIAAFDLVYSKARNLKEVFHHWTEGISYVTRWVDEDFQIQADTLIEEGVIKTKEQYLQNIPKDGIYLHFLPFLKGMLYVGNPTPLKEEELQLVQSLADTFSTAYARYMDFVKLETAKVQVERTLRDLKLTQQQLIQSEKMASLGELTAGIAHEIQNPLNFVNNFSELSEELLDEMTEEIEKGDLNEIKALAQELKDNLSKIHHHGKRAGSIIKGMLEHSRKSESKREPSDLNALAEECLKLSFHGLRAKDKSFHANFSCDLDPNIPKIEVVRQEIGRVLLNLINNAFYAVNEKAKISGPDYTPEVKVCSRYLKPELGKDARVEISVMDNGGGIPSKIKSKIFQPFFTTKPSGQGTGLGLSISYDIVKGHGGELSVETEETKGTTFLISLPYPN